MTQNNPRPVTVHQIQKWIELNPISPYKSSYVLFNQIARELGSITDSKLLLAALGAGYSVIPQQGSCLWRFELMTYDK